ncbi:glycosyltransferase family 4 protein [bacterium]|nr:glycosyltransferase family 4 protein [bacterium]
MLYKFSALSFCIAFVGAWLIARYGSYAGLIDKPSNRSSHNTNIPKGGGVGILVVFVFLCLILDIMLFFWLPVFLLSFISFLGDRFELSAKFRLIIQFITAGIVLYSANDISWIVVSIEGVDSNFINITGYFVILVFIVGTTNFYNFMDGINGIAGITGIIAFTCLGYVSLTKDMLEITILLFGISSACLGFLFWNLPKAKVFMGDVSSILLGFVFAICVVLLSNSLTEFICYAGFILPFYADELLTMIERIKHKYPLSQAHRRHLYQVLVNEGGFDHWIVSLGYGIIQLAICVLLMSIEAKGHCFLIMIIIAIFGLFASVNFCIKKKLTNQQI